MAELVRNETEPVAPTANGVDLANTVTGELVQSFETLEDIGAADDFLPLDQLVGATLIVRYVADAFSRTFGKGVVLEGEVFSSPMNGLLTPGTTFRSMTFAVPIRRTAEKMLSEASAITDESGRSIRERYYRALKVTLERTGETYRLK